MRHQIEYPPAPWRLRGHAVCRLHLLDVSRAKPFVPPEVSILSVLPGKTLGGIYLAAYQSGSILEYHELIIVPALVHYGYRVGAWVSHIYVDDQRSVAGGREIWGLPKEQAAFTWDEPSGEAVVRQGEQLLCTLHSRRLFGLGRLPVILPAFSCNEDLLWFRGAGAARVGIAHVNVEVPPASPFAAPAFDGGFGIGLHNLEMAIRAPVRMP